MLKCKTHYGGFAPVTPEEVDRVFGIVDLLTYLQETYPSWLVKATQEVTCGWIYMSVSILSRERMIPLP